MDRDEVIPRIARDETKANRGRPVAGIKLTLSAKGSVNFRQLLFRVKRTNENMKILFCFIGLLLCMLPLKAGFAQDKIVAIVNNEIITQKDLEDFLNFMRMQLSGQYSGQQLEEKVQSMKMDLLNRLIEDRLILQEAKKNGIKVDEARVKARIEEIKKRYPSEKEFQEELSRQGFVQADLESRIREQLLTFNIVDMKVRSKITVNPTEVTDFYQKNIEQFKVPLQRELESISTDNEILAKQVIAALKSGSTMQQVAEKQSLTVNRISAMQSGQLRKEIEEAVFKMAPGSVSGPFKVEQSYYIFKLIDIIPSKQQTLSEVQDKIYAFLFEHKMQERMSAWIDELMAHSYIKIM